MSASPAGPPSGPPSTTPNGGPAPLIRRKKPAANPFHSKKQPVRRPPRQGTPADAGNSTASVPAGRSQLPQNPSAMYSQPVADPDDDPSLYTEFPLIISKKALMEGKRFHAMRLQSDKEVNPFDESQFTRPLRLHRRFPRDTMNMPDPNADTTADDKEREKDAIRRAEREAEKEANRAQIAPTDKSAARKKQQFKKKTEDVYYPTDTPEAQKRQRLRYEEGRPWHLEDFDGKNTWVGSYEEPLSETNAMLKIEGAGFTVVPLEKWYKFTPTGRYKTMDLDEAEARMEKKMKDSRWFMGGADDAQRRREEIERQARLQRGRVGMRGEGRAKREDDDEERMDIANDVDEIDFEFDDEFQDDDEGKLFGGDDEDVKDAERRIREEQRAANIFAGTGVKEEKDWDEEEEKEKKKEQEERRKARKLRKNLIANERKFEYDSDSDHPYSESDSEDSEVEREREEERKKAEEKAALDKANGIPSGASSHGTNTPSGRAEKRADPLRNKLSASTLKRPGSPNLSEASGSESSHKRLKKKHENGVTSRPMSPAVDGSSSPNGSARIRGGNGSDTEASGNEKRSRPSAASPLGGTPSGSRTGSRAGSPAAGGTMPTAEEIRAAIPAEGIKIQDLIARFKGRVNTKEAKAAFITSVKAVGRISKVDSFQYILPKA